MLDRKMLKNIDYGFLAVVLIILAYSALVLSSASSNVTNDPLYFVKRQLLWIGIGFGTAGIILWFFNYEQFSRWSRMIYIFNLIILAGVLILGSESNGAQRWIGLGPFLFQPSEFAKIAVVITFADFLAKRQGNLNLFKDLIPCFLYILPPMLLILLQPDLGTSLVFIAMLLGMMFVAGANPKILSGLIIGGGTAGVTALLAHFQWGLWLPLKDYQLMRLIVFLNPYNDGFGGRGAGYHVIQSQVAVGSGGLWGQGLFQGSQVQFNFLPEHHTDFIFSVVGEELGFIGAMVLLTLYLLLVYRAVLIAMEAKDLFGALMVTGIVSMLVFQLLVNVGMTIGIMPITGLPLPFFSYGGSSMLANMIALGIILNVNIRRQKITF